MNTNLKIDPDLLKQAKQVGQFATDEDAIHQALTEYVQHHKQMGIFELEGNVEYFADHDPKALRNQKRN